MTIPAALSDKDKEILKEVCQTIEIFVSIAAQAIDLRFNKDIQLSEGGLNFLNLELLRIKNPLNSSAKFYYLEYSKNNNGDVYHFRPEHKIRGLKLDTPNLAQQKEKSYEFLVEFIALLRKEDIVNDEIVDKFKTNLHKELEFVLTPKTPKTPKTLAQLVADSITIFAKEEKLTKEDFKSWEELKTNPFTHFYPSISKK